MYKLSITGSELSDRLQSAESAGSDIFDVMYFAKADISRSEWTQRTGIGMGSGSASYGKLGNITQSSVISKRPISQRPYVYNPTANNPVLYVPNGTHFIRASYQNYFPASGRYVQRCQILSGNTIMKEVYFNFGDQIAGAVQTMDISMCFTFGDKNTNSFNPIQFYFTGTTMTSGGGGTTQQIMELTVHSLPDFS